MVTLQALEFSRQGYGVLVIDLYGTGDSYGDFSESSWDLWKQNIEDACTWLTSQNTETISLWGLRMGALLAADFAASATLQFENMIMWQPILSGETMIMQFLRLRVASAMLNDNVENESTSVLRKKLSTGQPVEVAGYQLMPELVNPLMTVRLNKLTIWPFKNVFVFEVASQAGKQESAANKNLTAKLNESGVAVKSETVIGPQFWSTQEISEAPELLAKTSQSPLHCRNQS